METSHKNENSAFLENVYVNETTETLLNDSLLAIFVILAILVEFGSYLSKKFPNI